MPKKKKRKKKKLKKSKKARKKVRKIKRSRKVKKFRRKIKKSKKKSRKSKKVRKINFKAPTYSKDSDGNSVIKVSDSWQITLMLMSQNIKRNINFQLKKMINFGLKREKDFWIKKYTKIKDIKYSKDEVKIKWFYDGTLNASANCIDRHLKKNPSKTAIIWVGDDPADTKKYLTKSYQNVCRQQMVLRVRSSKGDRVTIYLTMIPELAYIMLCKNRAVHSIIFGGFSPDQLQPELQIVNLNI